jgi:hypothetical protein
MVINNIGNVLINTTTDAGFRLDVNGTFRQTGSTTASGAIARGSLISPTLVAAANNDVLVGLDIAPTFTNGAFTGVQNYGFRISNSIHGLVGASFYLYSTNTSSILVGTDGAATYLNYGFGTRPLHFGSLGSGNILFRSSGNVILDNANSKLLINTTTDAGFKLDVNGTARVSGNTIITGSLTVVSGSATITNDLIVGGKIVAEEINVNLVSSSILYSSGSNKFGDEIIDNHQFTGSLGISGSIFVDNFLQDATTNEVLVWNSSRHQSNI